MRMRDSLTLGTGEPFGALGGADTLQIWSFPFYRSFYHIWPRETQEIGEPFHSAVATRGDARQEKEEKINVRNRKISEGWCDQDSLT